MSYRIISVFIVTTIIVLFKLGELPYGLTPFEVKLGLDIGRLLPDGYSVFLIRAPWAITAVFGLFSAYNIAKPIFGQKVSYVFLISSVVSPWFILGSRSASLTFLVGILGFLLSLLIYKYLGFKRAIFIPLIIIIFGTSYTAISSPLPETLSSIDRQRNSVSQSPILLRRVFINRFTETFTKQIKRTLELIDPGVYFFEGHPRERWGVEESSKIFFTFIPLLVIGLISINSNQIRVFIYLTAISFGAVIWDRNVAETCFSMVLMLIISVGAVKLIEKKNFITLLILFLTIVELITFTARYYYGVSMSRFSDRRSIYDDLSQTIISNVGSDETIFIDSSLGGFDEYLKFFSKEMLKNKVVTYDLNIKKEKPSGLIVDTLPYDANPSEPLYTNNGSLPNFVKEISRFDDKTKSMTIFLYR